MFGTIICDKGEYKWKFKLNKVGNSPDILIGVWRFQQDGVPPTDQYFTKGKEQGYAYYLQGYNTNTNEGDCGKKYATDGKTGDTVEMTLDLDNSTLRFKLNDIDYGAAYKNIKPAKYKMAVWLYYEKDSVHIVA